MLNLSDINFNKNENKFLSLSYRYRKDIAVLNKFDTNRLSILSLKKHSFAN